MKSYELKRWFPSRHFDPATFRQQKVLRFFGISIEPPPTKGAASGIIGRLFSDSANKHLWAAYVFTTGDEEHTSVELRPHDRGALAKVVVPEEWHSSQIIPSARKGLVEMIGNELKEGSPFDDPLPEISIVGKYFCFTGRFEFGSRSQCQQAVVSHGGSFTDGVTCKTDVLVIGSNGNPAWAHERYGNKILEAMVSRMQRGNPAIISESYWKELLGT